MFLLGTLNVIKGDTATLLKWYRIRRAIGNLILDPAFCCSNWEVPEGDNP